MSSDQDPRPAPAPVNTSPERIREVISRVIATAEEHDRATIALDHARDKRRAADADLREILNALDAAATGIVVDGIRWTTAAGTQYPRSERIPVIPEAEGK